MLEFVLSALATWRISYMLVFEDGPLDVFLHLRSHFGIGYDVDGNQSVDSMQPRAKYFVGKLLSCIYCTSVWVALPFAVLQRRPPIGVLIARWFALSAVTVILEDLMEAIANDQSIDSDTSFSG